MKTATVASLGASYTGTIRLNTEDWAAIHYDATQQGGSENNVFEPTWRNDVIYGNGGNDIITLEFGSDRGYGGSGNDTINMYNGNHKAFGGTGADTLIARGNGTYSMTGGADADRFVFTNSFHGNATVTDFNAAQGDRVIFAKPVVGQDWTADHSATTFHFTDGSSVTVHGDVQNLAMSVDYF